MEFKGPAEMLVLFFFLVEFFETDHFESKINNTADDEEINKCSEHIAV